MKIWYFSAYDQPNGHSSRTFWYASQFARMGHDVTMFTNSYCHFTYTERLNPGEKWRIEKIGEIQVVWLKTVAYKDNGWKRAANMLLNALRCVQFSRQSEFVPDVVIGPSVPILTGWAANRVAKIKNAIFIYEIRDLWPQALVDLGKIKRGGITERIFKFIEGNLYRKSSHIISALPYAYKHIVNFSVCKDKISWIPNGVDISNYESIPKYSGGNPDSLKLFYIGRFAAGHDTLTIIKCAKILSRNYSDKLEFIFVGEGPEKIACIKKVTEFGLKNVKFIPMVPKIEVPQKCAQADLLIASIQDVSIFKYGINLNKLYDYFASGRPVLFAANSPNDPVSDSGAGLSVPAESPKLMAKAIIGFLNMSLSERAVMGNKAKSYAEENYDIHILSEKYITILTNIIDENRNGSVK